MGDQAWGSSFTCTLKITMKKWEQRKQQFFLVFSRMAIVSAMVAMAFLWLLCRDASAVIIIGSATGNTSAPSNSDLATRWNQVGNWGSYLGTPIATNFFVTAKHIGGQNGDSITFPDDSSSYQTVGHVDDPSSDLSIWQISGEFPASRVVPMYSGTSFSSNVALTVFGRGAPRTDTVVTGARAPNGTESKGWTWGSGSQTRSWGTNTLDGLVDGGPVGLQLAYDFDSTGGSDQGILSVGDSGGPVFIQQSAQWRLAGINHAVGPITVRETASGPDITAALYDYSGLYLYKTPTASWLLEPATFAKQPAYSYSTSIPNRSAWVSSVIVVPEPTSLVLLVTALLFGPLHLRCSSRFFAHKKLRPSAHATNR